MGSSVLGPGRVTRPQHVGDDSALQLARRRAWGCLRGLEELAAVLLRRSADEGRSHCGV